MDDELKIQLAKLLNPDSILPNLNLRLKRYRESKQNDISLDGSNHSGVWEEPDEGKEIDDDKETDDEETDDDDRVDRNEEVDDDAEESDDEEDYMPPPKKKRRTASNFLDIFENCSKYHGMSSPDMHTQIQGDKVIGFCQEHGLIANEVKCSCGKLMHLVSKSGNDGCRWMCYVKAHSARPNQTIRKGTWFESSKLGIGDILWMAYMWVHEYSLISIMHECDHSNSTIVGWCTSCVEFCREIVVYKRKPIGGEGKSVEIFYRSNDDEKQPTERWAFCAIELNSTNSLHLINDSKDSSTLVQIFKQYFLPGTRVVANNWSALGKLNMEDFRYLTEKRSISFSDLESNKEIDTFKMFQKFVNMPPKLDKWTKLDYGPDFFETMYRKCLRFAPDAFIAFLKDIAMVYQPCDTYCGAMETTK